MSYPDYPYPCTYETLLRRLGNRDQKKLQNNTYARRVGDDIAIRLHATDIVIFHLDGTVTLDTDGWNTITTQDRINRVLSGSGLSVYSHRGIWRVNGLSNFNYRKGSRRPKYHDGMRLSLYGRVVIDQGDGQDVFSPQMHGRGGFGSEGNRNGRCPFILDNGKMCGKFRSYGEKCIDHGEVFSCWMLNEDRTECGRTMSDHVCPVHGYQSWPGEE